MKILTKSFFDKEPIALAKALLGKVIRLKHRSLTKTVETDVFVRLSSLKDLGSGI